jgi:hypothetical protein
VGVALEATLGVAVRGLVAGQVPDDESLVARSGQEHVGAGAMLAERLVARRLAGWAGRRCSSQLRRRADALLKRGSEGSNPARVALKGATENQLLGHDCGFGLNLESTSAVVSVRSSCAHCGISSCGRRPCFGDGNTWPRTLAANKTRRRRRRRRPRCESTTRRALSHALCRALLSSTHGLNQSMPGLRTRSYSLTPSYIIAVQHNTIHPPPPPPPPPPLHARQYANLVTL